MRSQSNLLVNLSMANFAHSALLDKLKEGWEYDFDGGLSPDFSNLIFTAILYHKKFDGELELFYQMDDTVLIGIEIEMTSRNYSGTIKKSFPSENPKEEDYIDPEDIIDIAAKAVNLSTDLLLLKQ